MGVIVRQKEKGRGKPWWVFINHNNKRKSVMVGDKAAAEKVASDIRAQLKLGQFDLETKREKLAQTFNHCAKKWIDTSVPATCKPSTIREYQDILKNHIYPVFSKNQDISSITRGDVKSFLLGKLNDGYATSTVGHFRDCLSGIFNLALDHEIIQANPAMHLGKGLLKKKGSKMT